MRVLLKIVLDCPPDAAWDAIRDPRVLGAVSAPLVSFDSLEPGGFPERWGEGEHPVLVRAAGLVPIGEQIIGISFPELPGVRAMRDTGRGLSGPLALVTRWQHTLTVAPTADGRTLYRDRLLIEAGALTPALWLMYWAFWQWRAIGMRRLAPSWASRTHPAG
ncbi:hypothetical protein [Schumannella luteola]